VRRVPIGDRDREGEKDRQGKGRRAN
jgi:hypothetical protein